MGQKLRSEALGGEEKRGGGECRGRREKKKKAFVRGASDADADARRRCWVTEAGVVHSVTLTPVLARSQSSRYVPLLPPDTHPRPLPTVPRPMLPCPAQPDVDVHVLRLGFTPMPRFYSQFCQPSPRPTGSSLSVQSFHFSYPRAVTISAFGSTRSVGISESGSNDERDYESDYAR